MRSAYGIEVYAVYSVHRHRILATQQLCPTSGRLELSIFLIRRGKILLLYRRFVSKMVVTSSPLQLILCPTAATVVQAYVLHQNLIRFRQATIAKYFHTLEKIDNIYIFVYIYKFFFRLFAAAGAFGVAFVK